MTVAGDEIILNCRECFVQNGYGISLTPRGNEYVCRVDREHRYVIKNGMLNKVTGNSFMR